MSQQINLFNPIFLKQKKYFSALTMAQALLLILVGAVVLFGCINYYVSKLSKEADQTEKQLAMIQEQATKINQQLGPVSKDKALEEQIIKADAETKSLQQVFDTLQKGEFGNTKGYSEYFRAFSRQIMGDIWLTGLSIYGAGNQISIQGRAIRPDLVPAYISRLKKEPVMQGKSFATLEMQTPADEKESKADSSQGKPSERAVDNRFIEFVLQSSDLPKDASDTNGAKGK